MAQIISQLQDYWFSLTTLDWAPSNEFCRRLLVNYSPETVEQAFAVTAPKVELGKLRYADEWRPYIFSVCRNLVSGTQPWEIQEKSEREKLREQNAFLKALAVLLLEEISEIEYFEFDIKTYSIVSRRLSQGQDTLCWESGDDGKTWSVFIRTKGEGRGEP